MRDFMDGANDEARVAHWDRLHVRLLAFLGGK